jgi:phosphoglycolate phosphatase
MDVQTILFDLDGTLTDPKEGITRCIQHSLGRLGRDVPVVDELIWCIGPPLRDSFSVLLGSDDAGLIEDAMTLYRERFSRIGMFENSVYPGIPGALQAIHAEGVGVILATSKPTVYAVPILDHFGLSQFFRGMYGSELDGRLSDKGELVAHIVAAEGLDRRSSVMVGDRSHDVAGGRKNGIRTGMVAYGYGDRDEISQAEPDVVFGSPGEIVTWIGRRG